MKRSPYISRALTSIFCISVFAFAAASQSRDQNFPTAVTSNEINGVIKARDVGDSRLTSYYYAFEGVQGDIFINVLTKNFAGDFDVFLQDGLRPMTKIIIFDPGANETGRLIYLRRAEKLLLRVQGRTPNDDAAEFRIKFGGSFVALQPRKEESAPTLEPASEDSRTVVNSVGTIVAVKPKPDPVKERPSAEPRDPSVTAKADPKIATTEPAAEVREADPLKQPETKKPEVVVESRLKPPSRITSPNPPVRTLIKSARKAPPKTPPKVEKKVDPMENIRLVIQMKDGTVVERPMPDVLRFVVDKGVLTVISKSGSITKFSILDVAKVTIE